MRKLKKKLIILAIASAVFTVIVLITAVLGALSQLTEEKESNLYYSGSIEDLPEILTIEMINGAISSEQKYGVAASGIFLRWLTKYITCSVLREKALQEAKNILQQNT